MAHEETTVQRIGWQDVAAYIVTLLLRNFSRQFPVIKRLSAQHELYKKMMIDKVKADKKAAFSVFSPPSSLVIHLLRRTGWPTHHTLYDQ